MKTFNLETAANIAFTAQGYEGEINPTEFASGDAVETCLIYGVRRMVQDHVNSKAASRVKDGEEVSDEWIAETVEARVKAILSGNTSQRGESLDPMTALRVQVLKAAANAKKGNAWLHDAGEEISAALGADTVRAADVAAALESASEKFLARLDRECADYAKKAAKKAEAQAERAATLAKLTIDFSA